MEISEGNSEAIKGQPENHEHSAEYPPARESEKAKAYNRAKRVLFIVELAVGLAYLLFLVVSGVSVAGTRWLESLTDNTWIVVLLYLVGFGLVYEAVAVPLDFYGGYLLEHAYGQSTQSLWSWIFDEVKAKLLGLAIGVPLIEMVYCLLRQFPHHWWLVATFMFITFAIVLANLAPVIIMPLFYHFVPLRDEDLKSRLISLCERVGTGVRGVYEMDMSRKTRAANAALVGLGNTRRIVLGDTLLERYVPDEIELILAHELGHHKNQDIWKGLAFQAAISAVGFYAAYRSLNAGAPLFGMRGAADVAAFPLLMLTVAAVSLLTLPLSNAFSRSLERRADSFALELTAKPGAFVGMMRKLGRQNLSEFEPHPLIEFILFSHPSISKRIRMAERMFPDETQCSEG